MSLALDREEVRARVANGLAWLKSPTAQEFGFDYRRINIMTLDLSNPSRCVLPQAFGGALTYGTLRTDMAEEELAPPVHNRTWDEDHGFWVTSADMDDFDDNVQYQFLAYKLLTQAWIRALRADPGWCEAHDMPVVAT